MNEEIAIACLAGVGMLNGENQIATGIATQATMKTSFNGSTLEAALVRGSADTISPALMLIFPDRGWAELRAKAGAAQKPTHAQLGAHSAILYVAAAEAHLRGGALGCPFLAPPEVPGDRAEILRLAFDETMKDPAFLTEAIRADLEVATIGGAALQNLVAEIYRTPKNVVEKTRAIVK